LGPLPAELLARVLQDLPTSERLGSCARASRAWNTAALAATTALQLQVTNWRAADTLNFWLEKHGSKGLKQLSLSAAEPVGATCDDTDVTVSLPWASISQLQTLSFAGNMLVMPEPPEDSCICGGRRYSSSSSSSSDSEGGGSSSPLASLTALTHLQLSGCHTGFCFGARDITALTSLQHLELTALPKPYRMVMNCYDITAGANYAMYYGFTLGQLVQLTELKLSSCDGWLGGGVLAAAGNLGRLQVLTLGCIGSRDQPVRLQDLPSSLVDLNLVCCATAGGTPDAAGGSSSSSSSWQLQHLRSLQLQFAVIQPRLLLHMTQLRKLNCGALCSSVGQAMCMQDMLAVLPQLLLLEDLSIVGYGVPAGYAAAAAAAEYAALTASSHLAALELHGCAIPAAAVQHMFAAGKLLPHLQRIIIDDVARHIVTNINVTDDITEDEAAEDDEPAEESIWKQCRLSFGPADGLLLARCCPALQQLSAVMVDDDLGPEGLQALLQLSKLTYLAVGGNGVDDSMAEHVLAKFTGG
jgi:hypothetical protein